MSKDISAHLIAKALELELYDLPRDNFVGWLVSKVTRPRNEIICNRNSTEHFNFSFNRVNVFVFAENERKLHPIEHE